jgi:hypothetical protein
MDDQRTSSGRVNANPENRWAFTDFGDGSGGGSEFGRFTFVQDLGCGFTLLGFVVFLVAVLILREVFF